MNTREAKQARQRRLTANARAKDRQHEIGQEQTDRKAAAAALNVPQARAAAAKAQEQPTYLMGTYVHRVTGSRIRLMDTKAPDGPRRALAPEITPDGTTLRYAVECLDHGTGPLFFATLKEAERAVRQSPTWCAECKQLLDARPRVRGRNRARTRDQEPNGQIARSRPAQ
jgi:hypothetical protein